MHYLRGIFLLVAALCCLTCKDRDVENKPDDSPRILSIQVPGVSNEGISIDQNSYEISIKLPVTLDKDIEPVVQLSANAELSPHNAWQTIFSSDCTGCNVIRLLRKGDQSGEVAAKYRITLIPAGKMEMVSAAVPLEYVLHNHQDDKILIPVRNLYGNALPAGIRLMNNETKESIVLSDTLLGDGRYKYLARGWGESFNFLWLQMTYINEITPGPYTLELIMRDGTKIMAPDAIQIKKGPMMIDDWEPYQGPEVIPGGDLTIYGRNLFRGDISIQLIDSLDQAQELKPFQFDPYGNKIAVKIPLQVQYGRYVVSIQQKAGSLDNRSCHRLHIKSRPSVPFEIIAMGEYVGACSIKGYARIPRNTWLGITIYRLDAKVRLKLVSVLEPEKQYSAEASLYSYTLGNGEPVMRIPEQVPFGVYEVTLQVLNDENQVIEEGPPFWRKIEVF